jgi:hypothetical protein
MGCHLGHILAEQGLPCSIGFEKMSQAPVVFREELLAVELLRMDVGVRVWLVPVEYDVKRVIDLPFRSALWRPAIPWNGQHGVRGLGWVGRIFLLCER